MRDSARQRRRATRETRAPSGAQSPWSIKLRWHTHRRKIERRLSAVVTNGLECLFRYRANDALHVATELHVLVIFRRPQEGEKVRRENAAPGRKDVETVKEETERPRVLLCLPLPMRHSVPIKSILSLFYRASECHKHVSANVTSATVRSRSHAKSRRGHV